MFPNEIITKIIQHLSHRYIAQISLVCKQWYLVTRSPFIYKTIKINNKKQFYDFINITAKISINTNNKTIGYFVQQIILDEYFQWNAISIMEVDLLFKACPNITVVEGINSPELWSELWENPLSISKINHFLQLSNLLLWFTNNTTNWYKMIQHDNKYTSLEFEIIPDMIQSIDDKSNKGLYIQCQQDNQISRVKLYDIQTLEGYGQNSTWDNVEIINNEKYICYYKKVFTFTTPFPFLKHLLINFGRYSYTRGRKLAFTLELDERTLESIHQLCPMLESLELREFFMNKSSFISDTLQHLINKSSPLKATTTIKPYLSLKHLSLQDCFIHHYESFEYFSLKYPNISTLSLDLEQNFKITDTKKCEFKMILFKLLSSYTKLTLFSTHFKYWNEFLSITSIKNNQVDNEFLYWFMNHPNIGLNLYYDREFDMLTATESEQEEEDDDDENNDRKKITTQNEHLYMNHVKKLNLNNENNTSETLFRLKYLLKLGIHFQQLTTLFIRITSCFVDKNYIDLYSWLDVLSNLKKLHIENFASDNNTLSKQMTVDLCNHHSQPKNYITYPLEEIEIINTRLSLRKKKNGLTHLGYSCPSIHIFKLIHVCFDYEDEDEVEESNEDIAFIMDVPHLELNQLTIKNVLTPANKYVPENIKRPYELIIMEYNNKINDKQLHDFKIELPSLRKKPELEVWMVDDFRNYDLNEDATAIYPSIKMILNCKYVDVVTCINY